MADITWPFADGDPRFAPEAFDEAIEFDVELSISRAGRVSTQSLPGARWKLTMSWADETVGHLQKRRQLEAFLATLRGGADRLLIWNLLTPEPLGTMRGAVVLGASVAVGATTAQITGGAEFPNVVVGSGFESDTNADGRADSWNAFSEGATGTVTYSRVTGNFSANAQRVDATALGTSGADRAGIQHAYKTPVQPGQSWTLAADTQDSGAPVRLFIGWYNSGGAIISSGSQQFPSSGATWARRALTAVAPAGAVEIGFFVWMEQRPTSAGAAWMLVDNVQLEQGAVATGYRGFPNLLRGDRVSFGGQRVMLTADASSGDNGTCNIAFRPAHRNGASLGAAVTLVRPTTRYVLTNPVLQMPVRGAVLPGFGLEFVEE